jgi:acetoin utilization deacetylase AcuC-like enzyme
MTGAPSRVAAVRDRRFLDHQTGLMHPENPARLRAIYDLIEAEYQGRLIDLPAGPADLATIELVHTPAYIELVLKTADQEFTRLAPDTPMSSRSYLAAFLAVGACVGGLEAMLDGRCDACFALVRPPGHHALPDRAGGFCIFNNLGVTARHALQQKGLDRVLIVDWDVHHGHGIQDLFYDTPEVLYFSTHYPVLYPQTGDFTEIGSGDGAGYTINVPVPKLFSDADALHLYREILTPAVEAFRPEAILVAAGFDAHRDDPIGRTGLTRLGFGWLTALMMDLAKRAGGVPLLLALEGGYNVSAVKKSADEVLRTLIGDRPEGAPVVATELGAELVERARTVHRQYGLWT